jgi:hypothetical protein
MQGKSFSSVEIESTHSPCTDCGRLLTSWLEQFSLKLSEAIGSYTTLELDPGRLSRTGGRTFKVLTVPNKKLDIRAVFKYERVYGSDDRPMPQRTTRQCLNDMSRVGWQVEGPEPTGLA